MTALREANQVGDLQPTTLIAYDADICDVFDSRDEELLASFDMTPEALGAPTWRDAMLRGEVVPTQVFAEAAIARGYAALLVRSYARNASATDLNMVLWTWNADGLHKLTVIDDENRLTRKATAHPSST